MGVAADEQWAVDATRGAVPADRLRDREDVGLVERGPQRAAAVAGGAERDALLRHRGIGALVIVGADQLCDVHEIRLVEQRSCERVRHGLATPSVRTSSRVGASSWLRTGSRTSTTTSMSPSNRTSVSATVPGRSAM